MKFSIPWIGKWVPMIGHTEDEISCIKRASYTKFWEKMNKKNPETNQLYCIDTISLIEKKLRLYQEKMSLVTQKENSSIDQIRGKLSMQPKESSREMLIEAYGEEIKNNLLQRLDGEIQSVKLDTSMAFASQIQEDYQDAQNSAQDTEEVSIEDVFEILKSTLKTNSKE